MEVSCATKKQPAMTHQDECPAINDLMHLLIEHGPVATAPALATPMNHAMQIEREQVLKAESRSVSDRRGALRPRDHLDPGEPGGGRTRRAAQCLAEPANRRDHLSHSRCPLRKSPPRQGDRALLTAIGVGPDGKRSILGCSVQLSEAETHWRKFLESLVDRGMWGITLVVSDVHRVVDADEPAEAERRLRDVVPGYQKPAPQLTAWLDENVPTRPWKADDPPLEILIYRGGVALTPKTWIDLDPQGQGQANRPERSRPIYPLFRLSRPPNFPAFLTGT